MPLSCSTATTRLEALQRLRQSLAEAIEQASVTAVTPEDKTKKKAALVEAKRIKKELETGIKELSRDSNDIEYLEDEVFKDHFIGPEQIKEVFNLDIDPVSIPEIPYTHEQLEQGAKDNCMLVLFVSLTGKEVYERTKAKYENNPDNGKLLNYIDDPLCWYKTDLCFTTEVPTMQWKLVPIETLPNSTNKTYAMQTKELRDHLKSIGHLTPEEEQECTDEKLAELDTLAKTDKWIYAADSLTNLKINQNHRLSFSEELQRMTLSFLSRNTRINESIYSWTKSVSYNGHIMIVGRCGVDGAIIDLWFPSRSRSIIALSFSR